MSTTTRSFVHRFVPGADTLARPLLLLHGTGGDENDLIPLGEAVAPGAPLLSPRGKVLENGMPRFFRRLAEGVFDEQDVHRRAHELADFVEESREIYGLAAPVALGYSNGANIAAALLLLRPRTLAGAALLRPMMPLRSAPADDLTAARILLVSGLADPIARPETVEPLRAALAGAGAKVEQRVLPVGHGLTRDDIEIVGRWLEARPAD